MPEIKIKRFSRSKELIKEEGQFDDAITENEILVKPKLKRQSRIKPIPEVNLDNNIINEIDENIIENEIDNNDNDFLKELNFGQEEEVVKEKKIIDKSEMENMMSNLIKGNKTKSNIKDDDNDSVYSNVGTQIKGRDNILLTSKIKQFKLLFPEELKAFKIKKNATTQELKAYIAEMEIIVEIGTMEEFITDSILQSLLLVEGISSYTDYNISGMSQMLQTNKQFTQLSKQLYLKYNVFSKVPPEMQMIFLIATTAFVCKLKNDKKAEMNLFLNQPYVNENDFNK